jgi:hypothetical protein
LVVTTGAAVGLAIIVLGFLAAVYVAGVRPWGRAWGSTAAERAREMHSDAFVPKANFVTTMAITVKARPEHIWPWLMQMGYRRGGLYSYDWLDRLFGYLDAGSANELLPGLQTLKVGDVIPMGRSGGFPVHRVDVNRSLVLGGEQDGFRWAWEFGLYPMDDHHTRLVTRNRANVPAGLKWRAFMAALELAAFIMTRRMLIGLRRRAERIAARDAAAAPRASAA